MEEPPLDGEPPPRLDGEPPPQLDGGTPPRKRTPAYGLRSAGTHPTGMHSCFFLFLKNISHLQKHINLQSCKCI